MNNGFGFMIGAVAMLICLAFTRDYKSDSFLQIVLLVYLCVINYCGSAKINRQLDELIELKERERHDP